MQYNKTVLNTVKSFLGEIIIDFVRATVAYCQLGVLWAYGWSQILYTCIQLKGCIRPCHG